MAYTEKFAQLIEIFLRHKNGKLGMRSAAIAQFILESGRGSSELARLHNNFAGIKWRPEMSSVATKVTVDAPSETADFCHFDSIENFVEGYWRFLGRKPYKGWKDHADDSYRFIDFIGPIWASDENYPKKLKALIGEADGLISAHGVSHQTDGGDDHGNDGAPCCEGMVSDYFSSTLEWEKPTVQWDPSPFNWSRGGTEIDTIVMHYTTSRNLSGTVSWFKDSKNVHKTAAHYVIGRDGTIVQMVKDEDACTHGNSQNKRSIGIEHSAKTGDAMTAEQEEASAALVRWLVQEYEIKLERVIGHKCAPRSTSCPGDLFKKYGATSASDCNEVTTAIQRWLREKVFVQENLLVA
ncbi:N-acetylmuramoyl-L-alanine amidase [Mangrovicella endophytica]|uniref:N-acetylmuramoyl-L-alanine amidase n=1 Tax=Mangrovicella endophytica TaxID=2066697 RepID=UPI0018E40162|nr:N-acetylmuramoyl-L-alanine amidase [Mangrovicella endophytica]